MPRTSTSLVTLIVALVVMIAGSAEATDPLYAQADKIGPAGTLEPIGFFASSVAVNGDLTVVGAPGGNTVFAFVDGFEIGDTSMRSSTMP